MMHHVSGTCIQLHRRAFRRHVLAVRRRGRPVAGTRTHVDERAAVVAVVCLIAEPLQYLNKRKAAGKTCHGVYVQSSQGGIATAADLEVIAGDAQPLRSRAGTCAVSTGRRLLGDIVSSSS